MFNDGKRLHKARFFYLIVLYLFCIATIFPGAVLAFEQKDMPEKILSFHSEITVNKDSTMVVTETIKVQSTGDQIRRGIFRDFPTKYRDRLGNQVVVGFDVIEILRDGTTEKYHFENLSNGKRIYIGQENVILSPGVYTYTIKYRTNRQLGFFEDHDELYWNVTGNGWAFPMEKASARVVLPGKVSREEIKLTGYTGYAGSTAREYTADFDENGSAFFAAARQLRSQEGLTIVVSWPKGIVDEPTFADKAGYFIRDNKFAIIIVVLFILLILYYIVVWFKVGKDPAKGTIIPLYSPPDGFSPAAVRFLRKMGFDDGTLACSIINMAVKGYIVITEEKKFMSKVFTLSKAGVGKEDLTPEEKEIYDGLFGLGNNTITLTNINHAVFAQTKRKAERALNEEFRGMYFTTNSKYTNAGWLFTLLAFTFIPVIGFAGSSVLAGVIVFFASVIINIIFTYLLKAPTSEGRELLDRIEGFKMYLSVAEKDELNYAAPVEKTPELFEKYLPYALAMDVEQKWCEKFSSVLARAGEQGEGYSPRWYSGSSWRALGAAGFASSIGSSFSNAIASSSTPPGSSSGSSGGSSGGGGGGGGGGGW